MYGNNWVSLYYQISIKGPPQATHHEYVSGGKGGVEYSIIKNTYQSQINLYQIPALQGCVYIYLQGWMRNKFPQL